MVTKRLGVFALSIIVLLSFLTLASASTTLFYDDFEGTLEQWDAEYWESPNSGSINYDYGTYTSTHLSCDYDSGCGDYYLWIEDDASVYAEVDTTGYDNIALNYYRRTHSAYGSDRLKVYWKPGDYCNPRSDPSCDWSDWNHLESVKTDNWNYLSWDLPSEADDDEIVIAFFMDDGEDDYAKVDSVEVVGDEIRDDTDPTCTVDYLEQKDSHSIFDLATSIYVDENGKFYVYGDSEDSESDIDNVQYNRTSPDMYLLWTDSDPVDGSFNELQEEWRSDPNDADFIDGWHRVCCRAIDDAANMAEGECEDFCIDTQDPVMDSIDDNTQDCDDDPNTKYWNQDSITWTWTAHDVGCAGLDWYEVVIYEDDVFLTKVVVDEPTREYTRTGLQDGSTYYVEVYPIDNAGNWGDEIVSDEVTIDLTPPVVEITGDPWDVWYNTDFEVHETDSDNIGLLKCEIAITNDGSLPTSFTEVLCNNFELIDISVVCPSDGEDICRVRKKATDLACNEAFDEQKWDLDREAPTTTKTVGEPKVAPWGDWISILINGWFVTDETEITLECEDGDPELSGCDETYYRINGGDWITYTDPFTLGPDDGLYTVEYYSVDNVGNQEAIQNETDKVDTIPPETVKTYEGPQYWGPRILEFYDLLVPNMHFINYNTLIILNATDTQVGVDDTWWSIYVPTPEPGQFDHMEMFLEGEFVDHWEDKFWECYYEDPIAGCVGEPDQDACEVYNEDQCGAITGCDWIIEEPEEVCIGTPEPDACENYDESQCLAIDGCDYIGGGQGSCSGQPYPCEQHQDPSTCSANGCSWCPEAGCYGSPYSCDTWSDPESCGIAGCNWDQGSEPICVGTPIMDCTALEDFWQGKCDETPGCSWDLVGGDEYCEGTPCSCEDVAADWPQDPEAKCIETPGCDWDIIPGQVVRDGWEEYCNVTWWTPKWEMLDNPSICDLTEWPVDTHQGQVMMPFCRYVEPFAIEQECDHKICFVSKDKLGNRETIECQVVSVDNTPPTIDIHNPTIEEAGDVQRCSQAIVVSVTDYPEGKAGVDEDSVYALLRDPTGAVVRNISLIKTIYGTYEGLMDKELPAGNYTLEVCASDNLGNSDCVSIQETLSETIFVEYIDPAFCNIDPIMGGPCHFTFHVCMRGDNSIQFWMNKLGDIITPAMMNAMISETENPSNEAFVGLKHDGFTSEAGILQLGPDCIDINGQEQFDLHLELDSEVVSLIGPGVHDLEYWIETLMEGQCLV